jgi:hypothetical protein
MASYERLDERERERPHRYVREERYDERDRDFGRFDAPDNHISQYQQSRDLVPRAREETDLAVEEIRREFPPPGSRDVRRTRSTDPVYEEYDIGYRRRYDTRYDSRYDRESRDRDWDRDRDYYMPVKTSRKTTVSTLYRDEDEVDDEEAARRRVASKQEKILAALAGAALFVGGKEMYDRHEAKQNDEKDVQRNYLASAAIGAAGALAGYQGAEFYNKQRIDKEREKKKQQQMVPHGRGDDDNGAMTIIAKDKDRERDRDLPHKEGDKEKEGESSSDKNLLEKLLASAGLAGAVGALTGKKVDGKDGVKLPEGLSKVSNAARASIVAGAAEAFRVAREPGGWKGEKTKRIMTAAIGAASIDAAQNDKKNSSLKLAESVMGGLLGNRVINGSKSNIEEDKLTGRSRSRSRAAGAHKKPANDSNGGGNALGGMGGLAALATAGLGALGGKKLYDNYRDESPDPKEKRSRSRRRDDDDDDDAPPRRSRSRSVVDSARKSLAKLGIGNGPDDDKDSHRRDQDDFGRDSSRPRRRYSDDYDDAYERDRRRRRADYDDDDDDYHSRRRDRSQPRRTRPRADDSDLGDSSDDDKQSKKLKGKQILTSVLAVAATVHAAHEVYESVEKREARKKAVREGRLSPEEASKLKNKAILQDTASVGIAALGIKSAVSTVKEARERAHAVREFKHEREVRHQKRLERQLRGRAHNRSRSDSSSRSSSRSRDLDRAAVDMDRAREKSRAVSVGLGSSGPGLGRSDDRDPYGHGYHYYDGYESDHDARYLDSARRRGPSTHHTF